MRTWIIFLMAIIASCTGTKKMTDTDIDIIKFGGGGGFTGAVNIFLLKRDGTLSKEIGKQQEIIKTIDKDQTASLFQKAEAIKDYRYNKPGNMSSFIELGSAAGNNIITWSTPGEVDTSVLLLHRALSKQVMPLK